MGKSLRKILTREDIERAMKKTLSNRAAARYLNVNLYHYRDYARLYKDEKTGKTLYDLHMNTSGKGIPKYLKNIGNQPALQDLLDGKIPMEHYEPSKIKRRLLFEGLLEEKCARCGFSERRVLDYKVPLILHFKDKNLKNYHLDNLELLCYNCSFLYAASAITDKQVEDAEDYRDRDKMEDIDWEIDDDHLEYLESIGLADNSSKEDDYISRL